MTMEHKRNKFLKLVSANVISMAGVSAYILANTNFMANGTGSAGLAALNLTIPLYNIINGFALMFGIGGAAHFIISRTSGERSAFDSVFHTAILIYLASVGRDRLAQVLTLLKGFLFVLPFSVLFAGSFGVTGVWTVLPASEALMLLTGILYRLFGHFSFTSNEISADI